MTKFDQQRQDAIVALNKLFDEMQRTRFSGESSITFSATEGGICRTKVQWAVGTGDACLRVVMDNFLRMRKTPVVRRRKKLTEEERG